MTLSSEEASSAPLPWYYTKSIHFDVFANTKLLNSHNRTVSVRLDFHWQEEASAILAHLSTHLLHVEVNNSEEIVMAAQTIVEGVSDILEYATIVSNGS